MPPRIAIPVPHSVDREYAERAIVQYERAVAQAGGEPVRIPLDLRMDEVRRTFERCGGVLLPGSKADIDPAKYGAERSLHSAAPDVQRDAVDILLLEEAYSARKPVLGICYGLQCLNVFRSGSLVQHIPDFLSEAVRGKVNHEAGRTVAVAHTVEIEQGSQLGAIVCGNGRPRLSGRARLDGLPAESALDCGNKLRVPVNSSHHQSAATIGKGLRISARCPDDGIIEALEGTDPDHFVLAVQWHPERSIDEDQTSRAIFRAVIDGAGALTK
jgi:putative glutamine amidotransferase